MSLHMRWYKKKRKLQSETGSNSRCCCKQTPSTTGWNHVIFFVFLLFFVTATSAIVGLASHWTSWWFPKYVFQCNPWLKIWWNFKNWQNVSYPVICLILTLQWVHLLPIVKSKQTPPCEASNMCPQPLYSHCIYACLQAQWPL